MDLPIHICTSLKKKFRENLCQRIPCFGKGGGKGVGCVYDQVDNHIASSIAKAGVYKRLRVAGFQGESAAT